MNKKLFAFGLLIILSLSTGYSQSTQSFNKAEIEQQFNKLKKGASVLYLAAHPDDENTRLISYLANGLCLRTAYLSLTRGDGGQNLIGPEQGTELGVIRTRELIAARMKDGGEQYFTRAYDFGFSKNPEETFTKWKREEILYDVVFVIRKFQPDIIITRFATDGSGGHGHHTASALLAEEAFEAAADPNRFPEQLSILKVWKTKRLVYNSTARFFNPNADLSKLIKLDVGGFNQNLGKSYGEIAAESRSMHKSQGFGSALQRGEQLEYFKPILGDTQNLNGDIFNGIELSNKQVDKSGKYNQIIEKIYEAWIQNKTSIANKQIALAKQHLKSFGKTSDFYHFKLLENLQLAINGIYLESTVEKSAMIAHGDSLNIKLFLISRLNPNIILKNVKILQSGSEADCSYRELANEYNESLKTNIPFSKTIKTFVCSGSSGNLYWLKSQPLNELFQQDKLTQIGHDYGQDNSIQVSYLMEIDGEEIIVNRDAFYKQVDPEKGELHRNFVAINPIQLELLNEVLISTNSSSVKCLVKVKSGIPSNESYDIMLELPENWKSTTPSQKIELKKDEEKIIAFEIMPMANAKSGKLLVKAKNSKGTFQTGIKEIKYNHIPTQVLFPESKAQLVNLDLKRTKNKIAYIPGAGDEVANCLKSIGYDVTELNDERLSKEDLNQYQTIVFGVRAFNTNENLSKMKQKFLDYMNNGGNILVQYNTNSWAGPLQSDIGPYKFKITRDRVTDERATVNFLNPTHPVLNSPNKISNVDFDNWIQERGIYFAGDLDSNYQTILSMSDPGEKANAGSLIVSKYGKGHFIYTGLAFFRQLPAGVPGAYRLFVNLIEL